MTALQNILVPADGDTLTEILRLAMAVALGALVGLERGRHSHEEGQGWAGVRTFTLVGLLGGLTGLFTAQGHTWMLGAGFLGMLVAVAVFYAVNVSAQEDPDRGGTTEIAAVVLYLGASLVFLSTVTAVSVVLMLTAVLAYKTRVHAWTEAADRRDLTALMKFVLIAGVILPLTPDQGMGPWDAINPRTTWWMVVLISGLSFASYLGIRVVGRRHGLMLTGILGGFLSSTAVTLTYAGRSRDSVRHHQVLACAVIVASSAMFLRVAVEVAAFNPALLPLVVGPMVLMFLVGLGAAVLVWRTRVGGDPPAPDEEPEDDPAFRNPLRLSMALKFGAFVAGFALVATWARRTFDTGGTYMAALLGGLADVDAPVLHFAERAGATGEGALAEEVAVRAILLAAASNSLVKAGMAAVLGRGRFRLLAPLGILAALAAGGAWVLVAGLIR